ncbi:hypothetical protein C1752_01488 [Acaryochloris thomasi RCC1774]|uniref:Uncharacterized protein n=1 Tax=Acaryochloris thomasi RCC1774 TaxID=1764569 RepID=A0A2W1JMB4_9CYAN|nr:hypothetical protein C1752_01488 [Acaryochloris thomasi RCC1774]
MDLIDESVATALTHRDGAIFGSNLEGSHRYAGDFVSYEISCLQVFKNGLNISLALAIALS